jgi:hypothetical protein
LGWTRLSVSPGQIYPIERTQMEATLALLREEGVEVVVST